MNKKPGKGACLIQATGSLNLPAFISASMYTVLVKPLHCEIAPLASPAKPSQ